MINLCFITDTHFTSVSRVRNGDIVNDAIQKLDFVVDYCNKHDCILVHGGDFFDKPTVPDFVKGEVFKSLKRLNTKMYSIYGNHDLLYNNPEFLNRTSYSNLLATQISTGLDDIEFVDLGELILTARCPIITRGKPQVFVGHMFLNLEDGRNTFRFQDIQTQDKTFIVLGHDHTVYDPLEFGEKVKIFRPGSFLRTTRQDTNQRTPQLLHFRCGDDKLQYKYVPIETARPWEEVFKPKELKISKAQQSATYDDIINQIRNAQRTDITFEQALRQVADSDAVEYCMQTLEESKLNNDFKAK